MILGSVLNHVMLHQTVIGQETKEQLAMVDEYPDHIIGCVGGGSNFAGPTPLLKMYTMGHEYVPPSIHAGGLRYHGDSPIVSQLYADKVIDAVAYHQTEVFEAAVKFARRAVRKRRSCSR